MSEEVKKLWYKVLNPIMHGGGRVERDDFVKLTKEEAKNIGKDYLVQKDPTDAELSKQSKAKEPATGSYEDEDEDDEGGDTGDDSVVKLKYEVMEGLEHPRGTVHEKGAVLELTDEEFSEFEEGLLEKVEDEDEDEDKN